MDLYCYEDVNVFMDEKEQSKDFVLEKAATEQVNNEPVKPFGDFLQEIEKTATEQINDEPVNPYEDAWWSPSPNGEYKRANSRKVKKHPRWCACPSSLNGECKRAKSRKVKKHLRWCACLPPGVV